MAKLNGVKTIDMVNGEITKVAFGGVEYALEGEYKRGTDVGNLLMCTYVDGNHYTVGAFYEVIQSGNDPVIDDFGHNPYVATTKFKVFRKIPEQTMPTIEERVDKLEAEVSALKGEQQAETIEFEGEQYRKVERKAQAGDVVIFRKNTSCWVDNDKAYLVEAGRDKVVVDAGGRGYYSVYFAEYSRTPETVDVYEAIKAAEPAPKQPKPFTKGDIVVITANTNSSRNAVGDIGKIKDKVAGEYSVRVDVPSKPDGDDVNGNYTELDEMRHATAEEIAQYEAAIKPKYVPQKGDIVVATELAPPMLGFDVGDIVKVTTTNSGGMCDIGITKMGVKTMKIGFTDADKIRKATPAEVAAYEKAVADASKPEVKAPVLKAGDYVKVTEVATYFTPDKLYEVSETGGKLTIVDDEGDVLYAVLSVGNYVLATAEEVAKHAETEKWAKIGREPGEFKKGDIVRLIDGSRCGYKGYEGGLFEIDAVSAGDVHLKHVKGIDRDSVDTYMLFRDVELVAPVESLV